jgi:methionyl-tRNA formyltransferase
MAAAPERPTFAFLLLREHPYGRAMLQRLLRAGHVPAVIVEEDSGVADFEREKFLERIAGHEVAPLVADQAAMRGIPLERVPLHSGAELEAPLAGRELDLLVLGGTRVLRGDLLTRARDGVVNAHPGLLPECRGSASPAWSVYHDIPIGASTHLCDEGIDTGPLLLRRELPVRRGASYADLCHGTLELAAELMAETLDAYVAGGWDELRRPQAESRWPTFRNAPPEVLAAVARKLANEEYRHYAD